MPTQEYIDKPLSEVNPLEVKPKHAGGRPRTYTGEQLSKLVDEYFIECDEKNAPYLITGLCLKLEITRETLSQWYDVPEFSYSLKKAKMRCENYAESQLFTGKSPVGVIFNLKNNYGWKDERSHNIGITANVIDDTQAEALLARREVQLLSQGAVIDAASDDE